MRPVVQMRLAGASSSAIRAVLAGPDRDARWLGACRSALYLAVAAEPAVLVVLANDAVRLPCGVMLATTSTELPLTSIAPGKSELSQARPDLDQARTVVGDGRIEWTGRGGSVLIQMVREWSPAQVGRDVVDPGSLAELARLLGPGAATAIGLGPHLIDALARPGRSAVAELLGRGPGLTPSGDDLLAGFLLGARAFGVPVDSVPQAVIDLAPRRTSALSAGLLRDAVAGRCVDEVAALAAALTRRRPSTDVSPAFDRLATVGHTSGLALACGLLLAGERAAWPRRNDQPDASGAWPASTLPEPGRLARVDGATTH